MKLFIIIVVGGIVAVVIGLTLFSLGSLWFITENMPPSYEYYQEKARESTRLHNERALQAELKRRVESEEEDKRLAKLWKLPKKEREAESERQSQERLEKAYQEYLNKRGSEEKK
jgi:hypothetical protein